MAGYSNAIYHTEQQKSLKSYSKNAIGVKKPSPPKKGHFAQKGNEIKICSQNKCHHHLSNVCENSFRMFHSNWVISDYHSFVWQFEFPWLNLTNCPNKWMVIRNDPVTVKHTKWIFTGVGKVMMAFILATDFDFIAYMSKMASFFIFFLRQWRFWNMIYIYNSLIDTHTHKHTHTYMYVCISLYIYVCVCVCVCYTHWSISETNIGDCSKSFSWFPISFSIESTIVLL